MTRLAHILSTHMGTFLSFGAIQGAQILAPLLALPWLGRVLGPHAFGLLMYMCVIPPIVALFMDWGLTQGGARLAADRRECPSDLSRLLGSLLTAKIILAIFCLAAACPAFWIIPHAREWPLAYFLAVGLGIARGISPLWYYQGTAKNTRKMAFFDVSAAILSLVLVFVFIHIPEDWQLYLLFTFICKGAAYGWLNLCLCLQYRPRIFWRGGFYLLGKTRTLFGGTLSAMVYTNGAQLVLGYFLPAAQMGIIVAVSKILRAFASLINPLTQTVFPEICILKRDNPAGAQKVLRMSLAGSVLVMLLGTACVWVLAPLLIRIALGAGYDEAVPVLRIMILAAPLMACDYVLGTQTLVPFGEEKAMLWAMGLMAIFSLPLGAILAAFFGMDGAAFLPVIVEGGIVIGLLTAIRRHCREALFKQ